MEDSDRFPPGFSGAADFAPKAKDSLAQLLAKAEGHLEYLRLNEEMASQFPAEQVPERRALWVPLVDLIRAAMADPALEEDARLEAQRVWAEELRHSALTAVTQCVHFRSQAAIDYYARLGEPEERLRLLACWDSMRPFAIKLISTEDMDLLREHGFLRPGE